MVRRLRSTAVLAAADPRSVSWSTCRFSLRFSLISSATRSLSCSISSPPPTRLPRTRRLPACLCGASPGAIRRSLRRGQHRLTRQTLQAFARQFMRWVRLATDVADNPPATTTALANLMHRDSKTVARRHAAPHDRRAIGAHYHAVIRPARRRKIQRSRANVCLQLGRAAGVRKTE